MVRKLIGMTSAALLGVALFAVPTYAGMDEISAQAGTKGTGAPRTGVGPGTDRGNPAVTTDTGPGANTITPGTRKKSVKRTKKSTTGSR